MCHFSGWLRWQAFLSRHMRLPTSIPMMVWRIFLVICPCFCDRQYFHAQLPRCSILSNIPVPKCFWQHRDLWVKQLRHYIRIRYGIQPEEIFWVRKVLYDAWCIGWGVFLFSPFPVLCLYQHTRWFCGPNRIANEPHHFFVMLVVSSDSCNIMKDGVDDFHARVSWWYVHMHHGVRTSLNHTFEFCLFVGVPSLLLVRRKYGRRPSSVSSEVLFFS